MSMSKYQPGWFLIEWLLAFCSAMFSSPAEAYKIAEDHNGHEAHWPGEQLPLLMRVDPDGTDGTNGPECVNVVKKSLETWNQVPGTYAGFVYAGFKSELRTNASVWFARERLPDEMDSALAVTLLAFDESNGAIISAEVVVDAIRRRWAVDDGQLDGATYDLQSVVTHELGHVLGLDHTSDPTATMYALVQPGETKKRTLAQDDMDGLRHLYPDGSGDLGSSCSGDEDCSQGFCLDKAGMGSVCARKCNPSSTRDTCKLGASCVQGPGDEAGCLGGTEMCRRCGADRECLSFKCLEIGGRGYCVGPCDPTREESCPLSGACRPADNGKWYCHPTPDVCPDAPVPSMMFVVSPGRSNPDGTVAHNGDKGVVVLQARLSNASLTGTINVRTLELELVSSLDNTTSVTSLAVYVDSNGDGVIGDRDELLDEFSDPLEPNSLDFGEAGLDLEPGQDEYILVTADIGEPKEPVVSRADLCLLPLAAFFAFAFISGRRSYVFMVAACALAAISYSCSAGGSKSSGESEYFRVRLDKAGDGTAFDSEGNSVQVAGLPLESGTVGIRKP